MFAVTDVHCAVCIKAYSCHHHYTGCRTNLHSMISSSWKQSCALDAIIIICSSRVLRGFISQAAKPFLIYLVLMNVYAVSVNVIVE